MHPRTRRPSRLCDLPGACLCGTRRRRIIAAAASGSMLAVFSAAACALSPSDNVMRLICELVFALLCMMFVFSLFAAFGCFGTPRDPWDQFGDADGRGKIIPGRRDRLWFG